MPELTLRAEEIQLGDNSGNSGLCWTWQFKLPENPGNVTLRLDVKDSENDDENGVYLNEQSEPVGFLSKKNGSDYQPNIITLSDDMLSHGNQNHHIIQIFSGYYKPDSDTNWSRDDIYLKNIRIVHD